MHTVLFTDDEAAWLQQHPEHRDVIEKLVEYVQLMKQCSLDQDDEKLRTACAEAWEEFCALGNELDHSTALAIHRFHLRRLRQGVAELGEFRKTLQAL